MILPIPRLAMLHVGWSCRLCGLSVAGLRLAAIGFCAAFWGALLVWWLA